MRRIAPFSVLLTGLLPLGGCHRETIVSATYDLSSGRTIAVSSNTGLIPLRSSRFTNTHDTFTAEIGSKKVVVEPTAIVIDGSQVAAIPESTKTVGIAEDDDRLRIAADGNPVYDAEF